MKSHSKHEDLLFCIRNIFLDMIQCCILLSSFSCSTEVISFDIYNENFLSKIEIHLSKWNNYSHI